MQAQRCHCGPRRLLAHPHDELAEVATLEETDEGARRILQAVHHVLEVFHLSLLETARHLALELRETVAIIADDDEALHLQSLAQDRSQEEGDAVYTTREP